MSIENKLNELVQSITNEKMGLVDVATELTKLTEELTEKKDQYESLQESYKRLKESKDELQKELDGYKETFVTPIEELEQRRKEVEDLRNNINLHSQMYDYKFEHLQGTISTLKSVISAICSKSVIDASITGNLPGVPDQYGTMNYGNIDGRIGQSTHTPEIQ